MRSLWALVLAGLLGCEFQVRGIDAGALSFADLSMPEPGADLATVIPDLAGPVVFTPRTTNTTEDLLGVWGSGPADVYAVGRNGTILRSTDFGQTWLQQVANTTSDLYAVWGSGSGDVYAAGDNGILRHTTNGTTWTTPATLNGQDSRGMWGSSAADLWVVGTGYRIQRSVNGTVWVQTQPIGNQNTFNAVWGSSITDVFIAGINKIVHSDNVNVVEQYSGPARLFGIGGAGLLVLAVGEGGVILRLDAGNSWAQQSSGTNEHLRAVWVSPVDAWAVGAKGTLLRSGNGGAAWQDIPSGTSEELRGIWSPQPGDVYVVGNGGTLLHLP